jgi:GTP-binding protein EngB required for normal cell division
LVHVPTLEKELVPLDVPMINSATECIVDTTKYITIEEHNRIIFEYEKASFEDAERFTKIISELEKQLQSKHISKEEVNVLIMDQPPEESTLIIRSTIFNFIKRYGNEFQCMALKDDNLPNEKLFKVFVKVREQYKTSTPPPAWNKEIINATGILSF